MTISSILYVLYTAKQHVLDSMYELDATFDSKLNIYNFGFNKIFPGNLASSMIPFLPNSRALECDKTWIQTCEILKTRLPKSRWSHSAAAHMNESGMSEVVDTGNQESTKEGDWQKVFYVFWKYKNTKIKCI